MAGNSNSKRDSKFWKCWKIRFPELAHVIREFQQWQIDRIQSTRDRIFLERNFSRFLNLTINDQFQISPRPYNDHIFHFYFQVSWVRRRGDELHLLTIGLDTYASDSRFSLALEKPNDWRLLLSSATERDGGVYECQVSAHPPLIRTVHLTVSGE